MDSGLRVPLTSKARKMRCHAPFVKYVMLNSAGHTCAVMLLAAEEAVLDGPNLYADTELRPTNRFNTTAWQSMHARLLHPTHVPVLLPMRLLLSPNLRACAENRDAAESSQPLP